MNNKKRDLEKITFGFTVMFGIYWIYVCFCRKYIPVSEMVKTIIGLASLYIVGFGMFLCIIKDVKSQRYEKKKVSNKSILLCFLLQFTDIMVLIILVNICMILGLNVSQAEINGTSYYMIFMLLVFNPIIEEFIFRKILADKLLKYGEGFYILVSSFCFAIVHGVSIGFPQIIYTFILGMIWSYIMAKTGDIKVTIIMHSLSNFFGGILTQLLLGISITVAGIYSMLMMLVGLIGLIIFFVNKKNINIDGQNKFIRKNVIKDMLTNKGVWTYLILTLVIMIIKI